MRVYRHIENQTWGQDDDAWFKTFSITLKGLRWEALVDFCDAAAWLPVLAKGCFWAGVAPAELRFRLWSCSRCCKDTGTRTGFGLAHLTSEIPTLLLE